MAKIYYFKVNNMNRLSVLDVAKTFLAFESMTHKKLQKLCYYAYSWHLALNDERMFSNKFQAWVHGPVHPDLYNKYKTHGWTSINKEVNVPDIIVENEDVYAIINEVYESYGHLDGDDLELLTHQEDPWLTARNGIPDHLPARTELDDDIIREYFLNVFEEGQND